MEDKTKDTKIYTPITEDQIVAATVGAPKLLNNTIYLAPYDPNWPSLFARLAGPIRSKLGDRVLQLDHVGSTSVPGLSAKPIIDMVMAVADSSDEASYVPALRELGYTLKIREPDWYQHRVLNPPEIPGNLHVFSDGCEEIQQMILFRDWLRNHPDDRLLYEQTKRDLATRTWKYVQNYAEAKTDVVQEILVRARHN